MVRLARLVAGAGLLLGARAVAAQVSCDAGGIEVRSVTFTGNTSFESARLERGIATTPSSWTRRYLRVIGKRYCLDSLAVHADSVRLLVYYRRHGYPDARIGYAIAPLGKRAVAVRFRIAEGRPIVVDNLTIAGLDSVPEATRFARGIPLRQGARFDEFVVEDTRDTLVRRLRDRGYPIADVLRSYSYDTTRAYAPDTLRKYHELVLYTVIPGPRSQIGSVSVVVDALADTTTKARVRTHLEPRRVRSVLGIREGQLYRETSLEGVKRGLYLTEAFRHVDVSIDSASLEDDKPDSVTIDVRVVESRLHAMRLSLGWGNLDCVRVQSSYSNYAFMGRLRRLDLSGRLSKVGKGAPLDFAPQLCTQDVRRDPFSDKLNYYFAATVSQAALFRLPFIPSITLFSERRSEFEAFLRDTPFGLVASLQQGVDGTFPRTYSYQLEYGSTTAQPAFFCAVFNVCEDAARERLERPERTAVVGWTGTRVRASSAVSPTSGSVVRLEARHSSPVVGSSPDVAFNRGLIDASLYRPAFDGAIAFHVRAGTVLGNRLSFSGSPKFVPLQERLYAGGPTTVRGFRQNELGPAIYIPGNAVDTIQIAGNDTLVYLRARPDSGQSVVPTGGDNLIVANVELRLRSIFLPELVQYAVFVDAGQVWNRERIGRRINFNDIRVTPGVGVRVFSPIGPVRVDVGYNPYALPSGPAYYNPLNEPGIRRTGDLRLVCVSPGNILRVRLGDRDPVGGTHDPPEQIDQGSCPETYAPLHRNSFLSRLTVNFSIGQPF